MGIGRLILFFGICLGLWMALRWFVRTPPEQVSRALVRIAIGAGIALLAILAVTGHLSPLFAAAGAAIGGVVTLLIRLIRMPWMLGLAQRLFHHYQTRRDPAGSSADQRSQEAGYGHSAPPSCDQMSLEEACRILGVKEGAEREEIIAAHRRLALKVHPDRGGSNYLAAQINRAKEVLLKLKN